MGIKKLLAICIILLFIGVAVAPSINSTVVKAYNDNNFVEVTSQACGIQGFGNTTGKLTKQQYQNLEQYLVDFRARLNQTTTREEAVPIFKEALVELNKYGLLPKRMSVEQAQSLVTGLYQNKNMLKFEEKLHYKSILGINDNSNYFCLTAGHTTTTITCGPILTSLNILLNPIFIFLWIATFLSNLCPILFLSTVGIGCWSPMGPGGIAIPWVYYATGWLYTNGLNGVKHWSGNMLGKVLSEDKTINNGIYEFYPGILGFSGIKINLPFFDSFYLGHAFEVKV